MSEIIIDNSLNDRFNKEQNEEIKKETSLFSEEDDQSFKQLLRLQILIQKQNGLKELCK